MMSGKQTFTDRTVTAFLVQREKERAALQLGESAVGLYNKPQILHLV